MEVDDIKPDSVLLLDDPKISRILNSDNALDALLLRLKQSILTCDELAKFIKKKLIFEDEHYNQMRKVGRNTRELLKHDSKQLRQDSFIKSFDDIVSFDDKLYNVGTSYVKLLTQMYDQLVSLSSTISRSRKSVKDEGRRKEKECVDSISALEKLKTKYINLCQELEKLKNADPSKKTFTLKGSKTSSQQEEDVLKKIEIADLEYKNKVIHCKKLKDELLKFHRPANSKLLKNLILEIDTAISAQLQKYSTWNETLYMNSGVTISPLKQDNKKPSMRSVASSVDNEKDLYNYLLKNGVHQNKNLVPVEYQVHSSFGGSKSPGVKNGGFKVQPLFQNNGKSPTLPLKPFGKASGTSAGTTVGGTGMGAATATGTGIAIGAATVTAVGANATAAEPQYPSLDPSSKLVGPRPLSPINTSDDETYEDTNTSLTNNDLPPGTTLNAKTFGVPILSLVSSEDDLVPDIVTRCIQIIEQYGLELEGIYRTSANATKLKEMKEMIDLDPLNLSKIGPTNVDNVLDSDVYCVASLLKLFFANLPEPLLTSELYVELINAVKIQDQQERYITLHHIIFKLPDESYWTLRAVVLHLSKIVSYQEQNKMNEKNLGIVWGPTLMKSLGETLEEITWQGKVVEELIVNANNLYRDE